MKFNDDFGVFCDESGTSLMSRCLVVAAPWERRPKPSGGGDPGEPLGARMQPQDMGERRMSNRRRTKFPGRRSSQNPRQSKNSNTCKHSYRAFSWKGTELWQPTWLAKRRHWLPRRRPKSDNNFPSCRRRSRACSHRHNLGCSPVSLRQQTCNPWIKVARYGAH